MAKLISLGVMDDGAAYATNGKDVFQLVPGQGNGWRAAPIEPDRQVSIMSAYTARGGKLPGAAPQEEAGFAENIGRDVMTGLASVPAMIGEAAGLKPVSDAGFNAMESWQKGQSQDWKDAAAMPITTEDGGLNPDMTLATGAKKVAGTVAQSVGPMALMGGIGGKLAQAGMAAGMSPAIAGATGAAISEGGLSGIMNAGQIGKMVDDAPEEKLVLSEAYQRAYHALPADMDDIVRRKQAREEVKSRAMQDVGWTTSVATAIWGAPSGAALGRILGGETGKTLLRTMAKQGLLEAAQEAPQSAYEQRVQNETVNKFIDPNQAANEGVLDQFLMGIVTGGVTGAGLGGLAHGDAQHARPMPLDTQEEPQEDQQTQSQIGGGTPTAEGGTTVSAPELPSYMPISAATEASNRAREVRDALDSGAPLPSRETTRGGPVTSEGLSPVERRLREVQGAVDSGQPIPPRSRILSDIDVNEALPVEDIEGAPPLPETPPDQFAGLRQAGTDLNGMIEQIDAAPAPIPANIDVQDEFDGADDNIDVRNVEQIDAAPAPGIAGLLPPPTMSVDSEGNAAPQSTRDAMARDAAASAETRLRDLEQQAVAAEKAGNPEEAVALRREAAGYQQELGDEAKGQAARAARMPQGLKDPRILRDFYRGHLQGMADELQAGKTGYKTDEDGRITGRLPSLNPQWFQNAGITVAQTQHAIKKALAGRPLGKREAQMVGGMLDMIHDRRTDRDVMDFARENRAQARKLRAEAARGLPPIEAYADDAEQAGEVFEEDAYDQDWDGHTRAIYELVHEAHAIDPVRTEQIADSARPDADVARELLRIIHESKQPGRPQEGAGRQEEGLRAATPGAEASATGAPAETVDPLTQAPLPESDDHLSAQIDAFLAGKKRGVLVSGHVDDRPKTRLNVAVRKDLAVKRDVPQGTLYARPDDPLLHALDVALQGNRSQAIRSLVGQIALDISPEVAATDPADMDRIVQVRDENGGIITQVGATAETEQAATDQVSSQGATVETVPIDQGLSDRQETISSYSANDLAERETQKAKADAKRKKDEARAAADRERDSFTLTGSDREADTAAAAGQSSIFDDRNRNDDKPAITVTPDATAPVASLFGEKAPDPRNSAPMQKLGGYTVGERVEVSGRTIGPSTIETLFTRQAAGFDEPHSMARVVNDAGKRLDVLTSELTRPVDTAAHESATSPKNDLPAPTEGQIEAGNYKKGHVRIGGIEIAIENPAGSHRRPEWPVLKSHYGYIKGTVGNDKDHVDVFVKEGTPTGYDGPVFVIDQPKANGHFDEHKVMLGWKTETGARIGYLRNYTKGWKVGPITQMSMADFKTWLDSGDTTARASEQSAGPLRIEDYTENFVIVRGETRANKDRLKALGGKWLGKPKRGEPGWLFPMKRKATLQSQLADLITAPAVAGISQENSSSNPRPAPDDDLSAMFDDVLAEELSARGQPAKKPTSTRAAPTVWNKGTGEYIVQVPHRPDNPMGGFQNLGSFTLSKAGAPIGVKYFFEAQESRGLVDEAVSQWRKENVKRAPKTPQVEPLGGMAPLGAKPPAAPTERTAGQSLASAGKNTAEGLSSAIKGLVELFGGKGGRLNSGLSFDEETYAKAKPLFIQAVRNLKDAASDLREAMRAIIRMVFDMGGAETADGMKPYVVRFVGDVKAGAINLTEGSDDGIQSGLPGSNEEEQAEGVQPDDADGQDGRAPSGEDEGGVPDAGRASGGRAPRGKRGATGRSGSARGGKAGAGNTDRTAAGNYRIEAGALEESRGPAQKARDNVRAIELARQIDAEGRPATLDEQQELALYVGWGGLSGAFPDGDGSYGKGFETIGSKVRELLDDTEYATAQRSIQYAHYTSEPVIRAMWDAASQLGFKGGKVFEPGMGIGHFAGLMPADIAEHTAYNGLELDHTTARIARLLYPKWGVRQDDFTKTPLPENMYDLVIGNPPFADIAIKTDPKYATHGFLLHDYFFAKSLDAVRPGGLLMFISSAGTMNKNDTAARQYLADRADLVGAIRLPSTAFKANAGTEVTTDIIVMRKRLPGEEAAGQPFVEVSKVTLPDKFGNMKEGNVSSYFAAHPEMVLGEQGFFDKLYAGRYAVRPLPGADLAVQLSEAIEKLPSNVMSDWTGIHGHDDIDFASEERKEGSFYIDKDGRLMQHGEGVGRPVERRGKGVEGGKSADEIERIKGLIPIRDSLRAVYTADLAGDTVNAGRARERLNKTYDDYVKAFGPINKANLSYRRPNRIQVESARDEAREEARYSGLRFDEGSFDPSSMIRDGKSLAEIAKARSDARAAAVTAGKPWNEGTFNPDDMPDIVIDKRPNIDPFSDDQESYRLRAIERYNEATGEATKGLVFAESVITKEKKPEINSAGDAMLYVLNKHGYPDIEEIAKAARITRDDVLTQLGNSLFEVPGAPGTYETSEDYLSGNVRVKLAEAQAAARKDDRYRKNVLALLDAQPIDLPPSQISATLGMPWIPAEDIVEFATEALGLEDVTVKYVPKLAEWVVTGNITNAAATATFGTARVPGPKVLHHALNRVPIKVFDSGRNPDGSTYNILNSTETEGALLKMQEVKDKFAAWIYGDETRAERLAALYNERYNNLRPWEGDGSYLTTPGVSSEWGWRPHQLRVIARILRMGNTYMGHAVGAGKTSAMIGAAMEMRRLGLARKPMISVPNHMLGQFTKEFYEQYPTAKIMVADERRFHTARRKQFIAEVANQDLDAVIITHSAMGKIPVSNEFQDRIIQEQIDSYREIQDELGKKEWNEETEKRLTRKRVEKAIERLEQRLSGRMKGGRKDQVFTFEEMGVDFLFVDEAHLFRKLDFATRMSGVKGISPEGSQQSMDLYVKARYLRSQNPTRHMVLASGTPITNTMAELYSVSRYIQEDELEARGLAAFDAWAAAFGDTLTEVEQDAAGGYKAQTRFAQFVNVPELSAMVRQAMDVVTSSDLAQYVTRPTIKGGKRQLMLAEKSEALEEYQQELAGRMRAIENRKGPPKKGDDILLSVINDGRLAAIDMRLVNPSAGRSNPPSKLDMLVDDVYRVWKETTAQPLHKAGPDGYSKKPTDYGPATQMIFANLGIGDGRPFNVAKYIVSELVSRGVPRAEVALIADYNTHVARQKLFNDMNEGKVRVLIGSTAKMATGVNAQRRLFRINNLDPLWYPADDEQRIGRALRQGNMNPEIEIIDYSTKGTYDSQMWSLMAKKARFIEGFFRGDPTMRTMEDLGESSQYEQAKAMTTNDPRLIELTNLKQDLERGIRRRDAFESETYNAKRRVQSAQSNIAAATKDIARIEGYIAQRIDTSGENFSGRLGDATYKDRAEFGKAMWDLRKEMAAAKETVKTKKVGEFGGFNLAVNVSQEEQYVQGENGQILRDSNGNPKMQKVWGAWLFLELDKYNEAFAHGNGALAQVASLEDALGDFEAAINRDRRAIADGEKDVREFTPRMEAKFEGQAAIDEVFAKLKALENALAEESKAGKAALEAQAAAADPDGPPEADGKFAASSSADAHAWDEVVDTAAGPVYSNHDVTLFPGGVQGAGLWENEAVYSAIDTDTGARLGNVVVGITDGQIDTLYWIESHAKGAGTRIMRAIAANSTRPVTIDNIMDTAKGFWDKVGIYDYDGRNAKLDWQSFEASTTQGLSGGLQAGSNEADPGRSGGSAEKGLSKEELHAYLTSKLGARGVRNLLDSGKFKIVSANDSALPPEARAAMASGRRVYGYFDDVTGTTYLIHDNLTDAGTKTGPLEDGYAIFLHEVGVHFGVPQMLGDMFDTVVAQVAAAAKHGKGELGRAAAAARARVPRKTNPKHVDEETLAWLVTDRANHKLSLVKRVIAKIRAFLVRKGFKSAISPDALVELARGAAMRAAGETINGGRFAESESGKFAASDEPADGWNQKARDWLGDHMTTKKKVGFWSRSVGSMYHLAEKVPEFKPVFDAGQRYLSDTSRIAVQAEGLAPDLFRQMTDVSTAMKTGTASTKDIAAAAKAVYEGTLTAQKVYSDAELRSQFKLTDKQVGLYKQAIRTAHKSLDDLTKSTLHRMISIMGVPRGMLDVLRERNPDAKSFLDQAYEVVLKPAKEKAQAHVEKMQARVSELEDEGENVEGEMKQAKNALNNATGELESIKSTIAELYKTLARADKLKGEGYFPLMRFGKYTVDVSETDGMTGERERHYFGTFESEADANKMARVMREEYPQAEIETGILDDSSWRLYPGLSPEVVESFARMTGTSGHELFQEYLKSAVNNRSAMKRLIHRKGVPGFSGDINRTLATFVMSNARLASSHYHMGDLRKAVEAIPKGMGDVKEQAVKLAIYLTNPTEEFSGLRNFMFFNFLGGSIASALTNLTQVPLATFPYLSRYKGAGAALLKWSNPSAKPVTEAHRAALLRAEEEGIVSPQEVHNLMATARGGSMGAGKVLSSRPVQTALYVWGSMFSAAEQYNRRTTFNAAYDLAVKNQMPNPYAFAVKTVEETQFIYNRGNRPNWARGIGAPLFTFKQFSVNYLELLARLPRKQKLLMVALIVLAAGVEGLPFEEDLEDLIDTIAQWNGYAWSTRKELESWAEKHLGVLAPVLMRGVSGTGIPIDVQARLGLGNLLPGTGAAKPSSLDSTREAMEVLGVPGSLIQTAGKAAKAAAQGQWADAAFTMAPSAVKNAQKGIEMWQEGAYLDAQKRMVTDTGGVEAAFKGIGFQSARVAAIQETQNQLRGVVQLHKLTEDGIADKWARGIVFNKPELVDEARLELKEWNRKNPDAPMVIKPTQIRTRTKALRTSQTDRFLKQVPKEMRGNAAKALSP